MRQAYTVVDSTIWRFASRFVGGALLAGIVTSVVTGDTTSTDVPQLIRQLGSPHFIERQIATESLSSMGVDVTGPVREATRSDDPEIRFRAREILRVIRHDDRERVINAFIAGVDVEAESDLPGWSEYQDIAGRDESSRQLYVEMLEAEWVFLDAIYQANTPSVPTLLETRVHILEQMARERKQLSVGSIAALMLVAVRDIPDSQLWPHSNIMSLCYRAPGFDTAIRSGQSRESLRRLLGRLIAKPKASPYLHQSFHFALNYELTEGLEPARQVINDRLGIPHVRQYAILVLAKLGNDRDLDLISNMLDDAGVISSHNRINRVRVTTQVRDVALAALIKRTNQRFEDYGLPYVKPSPVMLIQPTTIGFINNKKRQEAIDRWLQQQEK